MPVTSYRKWTNFDKFFVSLIIFIVVIFLFYQYYTGRKYYEKFYRVEVKSIIVKRDDWKERTIDYYTSDGFRFPSNVNHKYDLKIGDSISKPQNTYEFNVFRREKENREYKHIHTFRYK